ncbi:hypothetical protein AB0C32_44475, partial [Streptosporangium sp. NPDC048865]
MSERTGERSGGNGDLAVDGRPGGRAGLAEGARRAGFGGGGSGAGFGDGDGSGFGDEAPLRIDDGVSDLIGDPADEPFGGRSAALVPGVSGEVAYGPAAGGSGRTVADRISLRGLRVRGRHGV